MVLVDVYEVVGTFVSLDNCISARSVPAIFQDGGRRSVSSDASEKEARCAILESKIRSS